MHWDPIRTLDLFQIIVYTLVTTGSTAAIFKQRQAERRSLSSAAHSCVKAWLVLLAFSIFKVSVCTIMITIASAPDTMIYADEKLAHLATTPPSFAASSVSNFDIDTILTVSQIINLTSIGLLELVAGKFLERGAKAAAVSTDRDPILSRWNRVPDSFVLLASLSGIVAYVELRVGNVTVGLVLLKLACFLYLGVALVILLLALLCGFHSARTRGYCLHCRPFIYITIASVPLLVTRISFEVLYVVGLDDMFNVFDGWWPLVFGMVVATELIIILMYLAAFSGLELDDDCEVLPDKECEFIK